MLQDMKTIYRIAKSELNSFILFPDSLVSAGHLYFSDEHDFHGQDYMGIERFCHQ